MNGAFVVILSDRFSGDRADDAFKEFLFRLFLHRLELSDPRAEVRDPVRPTFHRGGVLEPRE